MRALTLLSLVVGFTLLPAGAVHARTSKSPRCTHQGHERVVAHSATVRMLMEGRSRLTACSLRTGRRRSIDATIGSSPGRFSFVRLHGTTLVYGLSASGGRADTGAFALYRDSALRPQREEIVSVLVSAVAVGPGRAVAFVYRGGGGPPELHVNRPAGALREHRIIDSGRRLTRLVFSGQRLTWQHNGVARSFVTRTDDRCRLAAAPRNGAPGFIQGSELISYVQTETGFAVCWRATGATQTVDNPRDLTAIIGSRPADAAGAWFATATADGTVITLNAESGQRQVIAAPGADSVRINREGSVAWALKQRDSPYHIEMWAHDGEGTRRLDDDADPGGFGFDGSTLIWGLRSAELRP